MVGGGGFLLAGLAALYFVGVPIKEQIKETIDEVSTIATSWLDDTGAFHTPANRAEDLGKMIIEEEKKQQAMFEGASLACNPALPTFNASQCNSMQTAVQASIKKTDAWRQELDDIATGKVFEGEGGLSTLLKVLFMNYGGTDYS